jgi:molybdopterin synthase catalytic subunit
MRAAIVDRPIDAAALLAEAARTANGATALFVGTVRDVNDGRAVTGIEYAAYRPMAQRELSSIVAEAAMQFGTDDVVAEHRVGALGLGEVSVAIAVGHVRRAQALDATRFIIEEVKRRVPVWKLERYTDGTREWVDPTASRGSDEDLDASGSGRIRLAAGEGETR